MCISKNFDFFLQLPVLNVSSAHFLSFFSVLLLSLPLAFRILSGCREKVGVSYGQGLEMGPSSIRGIMGHFTTIFASKLICYVRIPPIAKTDCYADRSILALPSAHQENPVTFKLMTSQVVLKEHDHSVVMYGYLGVKGLTCIISVGDRETVSPCCYMRLCYRARCPGVIRRCP